MNKWSFYCNPAALVHSSWLAALPAWGLPQKLVEPLWHTRKSKGTLSRFIVERFKLNMSNLLSLQQDAVQLLATDETTFERKLVQMGSLFLHQDFLKIIDGEKIRKIKKDFGADNFAFLRTGVLEVLTPPLATFARHLDRVEAASGATPSGATPSVEAASGATPSGATPSKQSALLLGLGLLLKNLPATPDCTTLLCLKLPPLAQQCDLPQLPQGFGLLQNKIAHAYDAAPHASVAQAFALPGLWSEL